MKNLFLPLILLCVTPLTAQTTIVTSSRGGSIVLSGKPSVENRVETLEGEVDSLKSRVSSLEKVKPVSHAVSTDPSKPTIYITLGENQQSKKLIADVSAGKFNEFNIVYEQVTVYGLPLIRWKNSKGVFCKVIRVDTGKNRGYDEAGFQFLREQLGISKPVSTSIPHSERWLVSESWCKYCPAAKSKFLASGGRSDHIITMAECQSLFGFTHNPPYEFTRPSPSTKTQTNEFKDGDAGSPPPGKFNSSGQYNYGGKLYSLPSYGKCNLRRCPMCEEILRAKSRHASMFNFSSTSQDASPADVIREGIALMGLTPESVVWEAGSADGRVAIEMARKGCRVIGWEIDPARVQVSRKNVEEAGLSDRVKIVEGDIRNFDVNNPFPEENWPPTTHIYAYQYPELLAEIADKLTSVSVAVCPGHKCPGIDMELIGQCWVYRG